MRETLIEETLSASDSHWWYRGRQELIRQVLLTLPMASDPQLLDVGTGSGAVLEAYSEFGEARGFDTDPVSVNFARERGRPVFQFSGISLPVEDSCIDVISAFDVIEHVEDDISLLREMLRVTRPGGSLLLTVPSLPWLWSYHDVQNGHWRRYTKAMLLAAVRSAGWVVDDAFAFNYLLLPLIVPVRKLSSLRRESPESTATHDVSKSAALGYVGSGSLAVERALLRLRFRPSVGLSLFCVARKAERYGANEAKARHTDKR